MVDVCIAEGHGHRSDGTYDPGTTDGPHNEQRDSKPVARACTGRLRTRYGLDVASEHEMDRDPNWPGTRDWANRLKCRVCVSFHFDYKLAPLGAFSIQTDNEGRKLGWAIEAAVKKAGFAIRPYPDDRDNLGLLNGTNMATVIFECGRIGSEPIDEVHEQEAMGRAAADGIADYLGVAPKPEPEPDEEFTVTPEDADQIRAIVRAEVKSARRSDHDVGKAVWTFPLPHAAVKNKRPAWQAFFRRFRGLLNRFDRVPRDVAEEFAEGVDIDLTVSSD